MAHRRGRLSIVPTPIGHLDDITLRALATLREADLLLAEDTRVSRKLCARHGIETPLRSHHAHSSEASLSRALSALAEGKHVALLSDAGTPLISDPGAELVRRAIDAGAEVVALPGPSAVTTALVAAGLPFDTFRFVGFLPRSEGKRSSALGALADDPGASVFFESPRRLPRTLQMLAQTLEETRAVAVCRELTKRHEEIARGTARELAERYADPPRGEITVVVGAGPTRAETSDADPTEAARRLLASGLSPRDAARALSAELGMPRREAYTRVRDAKASTDGE